VRPEAVDDFDPLLVIPKTIDNSRVVREVDPRFNRDLWLLLVVVAVLVAGLVLYAWPHVQVRQNGLETEQLSRERERLLEENRKLRLEKAALESLARVEAIALRELKLAAPAPERVTIVDRPPAAAQGAQLARGAAGPAATPMAEGGAR
jgi:cell division protein FtsL